MLRFWDRKIKATTWPNNGQKLRGVGVDGSPSTSIYGVSNELIVDVRCRMNESATLRFGSGVTNSLLAVTPTSGSGLYVTSTMDLAPDAAPTQRHQELNCRTFTFVVYVVLFGSMAVFGLLGNTLSFIVLQFDRHSHAATFLLQVTVPGACRGRSQGVSGPGRQSGAAPRFWKCGINSASEASRKNFWPPLPPFGQWRDNKRHWH